MRILDRYILSIYLQVFWLATAAFCGIYLLVEFIERVDDFLLHNATIGQYLGYFFGKLPEILVMVTPLAVLLAVFLTLGGLSRQGELTAMRSGGVGLLRIATPLLGIALATSVSLLLIDNYLVPLGGQRVNQVWNEELKHGPVSNDRFNDLWLRENNRFIQIRLADLKLLSLQGVSIFEVDEELRPLSRIDAPQAGFTEEHGWVAPRATRYTFPAEQTGRADFENLTNLPLQLEKQPAEFANSIRRKSPETSLFELAQKIRRFQAEGFNTVSFEVDLMARLAMPLTCLIMAFFGIPFSLQRGRKSNLALGISFSVAIGVVYHMINAMLLAFGYAGVFPPWIAAWSANLLFFMLGLWLLLSVRQ